MDGVVAILERAAHLVQSGGQEAAKFFDNVARWHAVVDTVTTHSLLPLATAALILHELWFATQENRVFRVGWVLFRLSGFWGLVVGYGRIVSLLTGLLGGANAWPESAQLIGGLAEAGESRIDSFADLSLLGSLEALPRFFLPQ